MKIQDIVKQLQKNPQLAEKYDEKYLRSVVEEQLFLRDYKKTFEKELNEDSITDDEEEEEIELEPEEIPVEEPEPQEEPKQEPQPEEDELPEPDLDAEPEEEEPEVLPISKKGEVEVDPSTIPAPKKEVPPQKQDDTSEKEAEQDGYIRISPREAQELLSYKGKIFTAIFTKRSDGSLRSLNGMTGVRKYTSGGELPYSPKDKGLIPVYDLKIGPGPKGYRTIPIEGLKALKINGRKYKIDQSLQENMKKDVLKQIVKEVILEIKKPKSLKENKGSTVLGKDLKVGQEFMAKLNHPIVKLEPNNPTQGRILVYLKDKPQPINMSMYGEYGILEKSLDENSPSPQRQSPDREVIEKPDVDTPERKPKRRTLTPPTESPSTKPKAEGVEKDLANKMASRFQKLKK